MNYLANGMRFKIGFDQAGNVGCFMNQRELNGRWVALVAAEDDRHLAAQPDCRTCRNHRYDIEDSDCIQRQMGVICTNGDKYQEATKVVLWRTKP